MQTQDKRTALVRRLIRTFHVITSKWLLFHFPNQNTVKLNHDRALNRNF